MMYLINLGIAFGAPHKLHLFRNAIWWAERPTSTSYETDWRLSCKQGSLLMLLAVARHLSHKKQKH